MDWATWNWVDWLFVAMLLYGGAMGAVRGLSHELAMLIGMIAAVTVTWLFYEPVSAWLCDWMLRSMPLITFAVPRLARPSAAWARMRGRC